MLAVSAFSLSGRSRISRAQSPWDPRGAFGPPGSCGDHRAGGLAPEYQRQRQSAGIAAVVHATDVGASGEQSGDRGAVRTQHPRVAVDGQTTFGEGHRRFDLDSPERRFVDRHAVPSPRRREVAACADRVTEAANRIDHRGTVESPRRDGPPERVQAVGNGDVRAGRNGGAEHIFSASIRLFRGVEHSAGTEARAVQNLAVDDDQATRVRLLDEQLRGDVVAAGLVDEADSGAIHHDTFGTELHGEAAEVSGLE
jgi:hypothetical protein